MKKKYIGWIIAGIAVTSAVAWGPIVSDVEQAPYEVVESHGHIEIRDYAPMIVAEADVSGERKEAINQGFRMIADYIFGNNTSAQEVAMTAPVIQQPSEKIAMTAPVIQQGNDRGWKVRFVMPARYTMDTLPKPNNNDVKLMKIGGKRVVAIRFSGLGNNPNIATHEEALNAFIEEKGLKPVSSATYAFYNPPWTLPFLRRNEVMVDIQK